MTRFALVQPGSQATAFTRVAPRLRGGEFTAVVDASAESAQRLAQQLGVAVWAKSPQQLHERHDDAFDAWVAVTPTGWLIVPHDNRPLDSQAEAWADYPAGWLWAHAFRFLPSVRTVKESLDSGKLGATGLVRIHHWQTKSAGDVRSAMRPQLDVACWLVDQPPTVVFAQARGRDYLQINLGFADDRMAVLDGSTALPDGDDYYSLSVIGSTGAAYADDHHNLQLIYRGHRPEAVRTTQGDRSLLAALQEYLDAVSKPRPPVCGAAEWKRAQRLAAAVDESLKSGQAVPFA